MIFGLSELLHGIVEHLHLVDLLLQIAHAGLHTVQGLGGVFGIALFHALGALTQFVGHILQLLHLRGLLLQLPQLLLQFFGVGHLAGLAHLLGLLLEIGLGRLVTLGQLVQLVFHLLELFCQVGLLLVGQIAFFQLILEFFQIVGGLF